MKTGVRVRIGWNELFGIKLLWFIFSCKICCLKRYWRKSMNIDGEEIVICSNSSKGKKIIFKF